VTTALILAVVALITSIISGILGMGGGMMLLATMFCFMPHADAIPTHAAVQIASNGTRVMAFLKNVDGSAFVRFVLGAIPGSGVGMLLLWLLGEPEQSEPYLKTLIGAFILFLTFAPRKNVQSRDRKGAECTSDHKGPAVSDDREGAAWWGFPATGFAAGTAALTVGAVGPLIAPVFARRDFVKERLIATKAVCQLTTHVMKIPAFLLIRDLDVPRLGGLALVMICMVIPGTLIGKRVLTHVSERHFIIAYRIALTFAGLKVLIFDGLRNLPIWP
jgi:uncharacterized membrane protein YfcA